MSSRYAFELDHTSTYLRNRDMRVYYQKLNNIIKRKKTFLPPIIDNPKLAFSASKHRLNRNKTNHPMKFATHSIYEKYVIKRDNAIIYNKLDRIHNRSCQTIDDEAQIQKYLDIKRSTREGIRKIKENLLKESNQKIREKIYKTKPVLNALKMKTDFLATRNYYNNLRKVKPSQSVGEIFLTKNESDKIDKCFDIHNLKNYNKSTINIDERELNTNKKLLKKLGYGINSKLSNSQELS